MNSEPNGKKAGNKSGKQPTNKSEKQQGNQESPKNDVDSPAGKEKADVQKKAYLRQDPLSPRPLATGRKSGKVSAIQTDDVSNAAAADLNSANPCPSTPGFLTPTRKSNKSGTGSSRSSARMSKNARSSKKNLEAPLAVDLTAFDIGSFATSAPVGSPIVTGADEVSVAGLVPLSDNGHCQASLDVSEIVSAAEEIHRVSEMAQLPEVIPGIAEALKVVPAHLPEIHHMDDEESVADTAVVPEAIPGVAAAVAEAAAMKEAEKRVMEKADEDDFARPPQFCIQPNGIFEPMSGFVRKSKAELRGKDSFHGAEGPGFQVTMLSEKQRALRLHEQMARGTKDVLDEESCAPTTEFGGESRLGSCNLHDAQFHGVNVHSSPDQTPRTGAQMFEL